MKKNHLEKTRYWGPSNNTLLSVHLKNRFERVALDLGCGSLRNSKYLFNSGYKVHAVDRDEKVKNFTEFFEDKPKDLFELTVADYTKLPLGKSKYDIIVAQNTLSFNPKQVVDNVVTNIKEALKKEGLFAGNLYGKKDYRSVDKTMSFYTQREVERLLSQFGIIHVLHEDNGNTSEGKKWHTFEFIVEKK